MSKDDTVVIFNTGTGAKYVEAFLGPGAAPSDPPTQNCRTGNAPRVEARGRLGTPTSGRHSPPKAGGGTDPQFPESSPLGLDLSSVGGAPARERV